MSLILDKRDATNFTNNQVSEGTFMFYPPQMQLSSVRVATSVNGIGKEKFVSFRNVQALTLYYFQIS